MHAIIETGGKQYRVAPGEVVRVEKLAGEIGSEVELPLRAVFQDEGQLLAGAGPGASHGEGHHRRQRPRQEDPGVQVQAQEAVQAHASGTGRTSRK